MTGIAVEIIMKETVGIITENIMKIMMIIANRDLASRDGQPGGPD
ncbi:MAG TPA: hypothetical protein VHN12_13150 [Geobacteraceae bacterium]|nr:hypothetical protein [Geobacteraceae bacterium]